MTRRMMTIDTPNGPWTIPAITCETCHGIGHLTAKVTYEARREDEAEFTPQEGRSGDKCPMCNGRGMVGVVGGE
jgi:hypothetical protein